jgi:tetratricopeptide (TPR) repeat protein
MCLRRCLCLLAPLLMVWGSTALAHPGQHDQLQQVNRHLEQAPTDQDLYVQRGIIYSEGGQYDAALADLLHARTLGEPVLVAFQLGVLHYRTGDFEAARNYLQQYLERFPNYPPAYDYLARIARDNGDYDLAVAQLQTYFRLQDSPNPGLYLAAARMLEEQRRYEQALAILDQGQATLGVVPQLQRQAIALERARGQPELALARLQSLGPMLGESPAWRLDMAELQLEIGHRERAAAMIQSAREALAQQRPTPARLELQRRAEALSSGLESAAPITGANSEHR